MAIPTTETVTSRTGVDRFQRRWVANEPRAAVLLVHGVAEHSGRYDYVGSYLAEHGFDVLSFDLRGHGESGGRRGHVATFDDFLGDVEELLEDRRALGVPVILFGHSLGGLIAATYASGGRPAPDLLVLSAPALAADVPGWQRLAATALGQVAPKLSIPNNFDGELLSRDDAVGVAYRDDPLRVKVATARFGKVVFSTMEATADRLHRITVPTYVLHGTDDRLVPPRASEPFASIGSATRVLHEGLRHECLNEPERDEVLAGITAWIDQQLASAD